MNYVIELAQKISTNTFNFIFFKSYYDLEYCEKAVEELRNAFLKCGVNTTVSIYKDQHVKKYYIEY